MRQRIGAIVGAALAMSCLAGCTTTMTDDKLVRQTAAVLGVAPSDVQISDRDGSIGSTTYIATVKGRRYACVFGGGGVLTYGISSPPSCNRAVE